MKLYFKLDSCARIWLTSCTEIRLRNYNLEQEVNRDSFNPTKMLAWPTQKQEWVAEGRIEEFRMNKGLAKIKTLQGEKCTVCLARSGESYQIPLGMIFGVEFKDQKDLFTVIKRIWIDVSEEQIESLKSESSAMELLMKVC